VGGRAFRDERGRTVGKEDYVDVKTVDEVESKKRRATTACQFDREERRLP